MTTIAELIIKVDTSQVEKAKQDIQGLADTAANIKPTVKGVSGSLDEVAKSSEKLGTSSSALEARAKKLVETFGMGKGEILKYDAAIKGVSAAVDPLADRLTQLVATKKADTEATRAAVQVQKAAQKSLEGASSAQYRMIESLREEIALFGKSKEEIILYRAGLMGITDQVAPLVAQLQKLKAAKLEEAGAGKQQKDAERQALAEQAKELEKMIALEKERIRVANQSQNASSVERGQSPASSASLDAYNEKLRITREREASLNAERVRSQASMDKQAQSLRKLIASIDPATESLRRLDEAQDQLNAAFAASQNKTGPRLSTEEYRKYSNQIEDSRKRITDLGATTGKTAKEINFALRGLPAQFTDIFVSLQGGQAPLTVFLQQGGQLKDMFGGIGPAFRAMGGYILSIINPLTLGAAALGTLALAYYKGSEEADAFAKALALSGNQAGTSVEHLITLSSAMGDTVTTTGKAAEVLAQVAGNGKIAETSFRTVAEAAIAWEKATGTAIEDTVKAFASLRGDPLKAVEELDKQYNFLTTSTYAQIAALQEQGDVAGATALAEKELSGAFKDRAQEIQDNLGLIESAWNSVASAAKAGWDAVLDVGRKTSPQEALQSTFDALADYAAAGQTDSYVYKQLVAKVEKFQNDIAQAEERAFNERIDTQIKNEAMAARQALQKRLEDAKTNAEKEKAEYLKLDKEIAAAKLGGIIYSEEQIEKARESIRKKYEEKPTKLDRVTQDAAEKLLNTYKQQETALRQRIETSAKAGSEEVKLSKLIAQLADIEEKAKTKALTVEEKSLLANKETLIAQQQKNVALEEEIKNKESLAKLDSVRASLAAQIAADEEKYASQLLGVGRGKAEVARMKERNTLQDQYVKAVRRAAEEYRKIENPTRQQAEDYKEQLKLLKDNFEQRKGLLEKNFRDMESARTNWINGATSAWEDYLDGVRDTSGQTYSLFTNAFKGIEDYLVSFVMGTKASFKDLVKSIVADLARIGVKNYIGSIFGLGGGGQGGSGGGLTGVLESIFGGGGSGSGGGSGGGSLLADAWNYGSAAYSALTSGFGQAVMAGWNSGGLTGAISGGWGYGSNAIGNIGSTVGGWFGGGSSASLGASQAGYMGPGFASWAAGGSSGLGATAAGYTGSQFANWAAAQRGFGANFTGALGSTGALLSGVGGALYGYGQSGWKGAVTGGLGGWAGSAAGAAAGTSIGAAIGGTFGSILPGIGTAIGAALGSWLGGSLFGGDWQTKDVGIALGIDAGELDAKQFEYQKKKGGLFSSNKKRTNYSELDEETLSALQQTYDATEKGVISLFEELSFNIEDGVFSGLTLAKEHISTMGKTEEEIQQAITEWFGKTADTFVAELNKQLDTGLNLNFEQMQAFVGNLLTVNETIRYLNVGLYDASVEGAKLAEKLTLISGGIENLTSNVSTYYNAFFTEQEKIEDTIDSVKRAFDKANITLADTRQSYREMVESIDITTKEGQEMFATLMSLSGLAAQYYSALDAMAQQAVGLLSNVANATFARLQRSIAAEKNRITKEYQIALAEAQASAAASAQAAQARVNALSDMAKTSESTVNALNSIDQALTSALDNILRATEGTSEILRGQAVSILNNALTLARAGKSLKDFEGLDQALEVAVELDQDVFKSFDDFQREQGKTANIISELKNLNGKQLTTEEKLLESLQAQLTQAQKNADYLNIQLSGVTAGLQTQYESDMMALDRQLENGQMQIDALNGVDNSIISVGLAVDQMSAAVVAAIKAQQGEDSTANFDSTIQRLYQSILGQAADSEGLRYWNQQLASGVAINELVDGLRDAANTASIDKQKEDQLKIERLKYQAATGKPAPFATGGVFTNQIVKRPTSFNMGLMGEAGPEAILPLANVGGSLGVKAVSDGTVDEVKALREEVNKLGQMLYQITKNTARSAEELINIAENGVVIIEEV